MILKAFQIKNYKSFVESGMCTVQNGVTILAGQNESGKSNILSALAKINDKSPSFTYDEYSFDMDESPEIKYWFELSAEELENVNSLSSEISISEKIEITVTDEQRDILFFYTCDECMESKDALLDNIREKLELLIPKFVTYRSLQDDIPDTFTVKNIVELPIKRLSNYLDVNFEEIFSEKSLQRQKNATQRLSRNLSTDFSSKYKQKEVRLEFDINKDTMSFYVRDKKPGTDEYGYSFQLKQRSAGLRWYLNFYIALRGEDLKSGDIILVDEPGMYLHPKAQQEMRDILKEISEQNQIIYTTHSPYLIDTNNIGQIRLIEKKGIDNEDGYNEISEIKEKIHHCGNIDTLKPIIDSIGYSLGSELNLPHKKLLICEGVSDYFYIKALSKIMGRELTCGITHANGCNNIGTIISLFLGLGVHDIYVLIDSDNAGLKEAQQLIKNCTIPKDHIFSTHGFDSTDHAIEDIFNRDWYLKEVASYTDEEIKKAESMLSKEIKKKRGGAKYVWAKKLFDMTFTSEFNPDDTLTSRGKDLFYEIYNSTVNNSSLRNQY